MWDFFLWLLFRTFTVFKHGSCALHLVFRGLLFPDLRRFLQVSAFPFPRFKKQLDYNSQYTYSRDNSDPDDILSSHRRNENSQSVSKQDRAEQRRCDNRNAYRKPDRQNCCSQGNAKTDPQENPVLRIQYADAESANRQKYSQKNAHPVQHSSQNCQNHSGSQTDNQRNHRFNSKHARH